MISYLWFSIFISCSSFLSHTPSHAPPHLTRTFARQIYSQSNSHAPHPRAARSVMSALVTSALLDVSCHISTTATSAQWHVTCCLDKLQSRPLKFLISSIWPQKFMILIVWSPKFAILHLLAFRFMSLTNLGLLILFLHSIFTIFASLLL